MLSPSKRELRAPSDYYPPAHLTQALPAHLPMTYTGPYVDTSNCRQIPVGGYCRVNCKNSVSCYGSRVSLFRCLQDRYGQPPPRLLCKSACLDSIMRRFAPGGAAPGLHAFAAARSPHNALAPISNVVLYLFSVESTKILSVGCNVHTPFPDALSFHCPLRVFHPCRRRRTRQPGYYGTTPRCYVPTAYHRPSYGNYYDYYRDPQQPQYRY